MNRNSLKMTSSVPIFVINGDILGTQLKNLLEELARKLPDCEFKVVNKNISSIDVSKISHHGMFLVLNINDKNPEVESFTQKLSEDNRKYVMYPKSISNCSGYKAATFSELLRYISQMVMQSIGSMSQISINTITKAQKQNVSLHVIIAKSEDEQFRFCVKSIYKKYKQSPSIDFFESRTLQKIHTGLFPRVLFIICQQDIQKYRVGYEIFSGKKSITGSLTTVVFIKSSIVPYGFDYDETVSSQSELQKLLVKSLQNANRHRSASKLASINRAKSFVQPSSIMQQKSTQPLAIFVLDSVDNQYRQFYYQIEAKYQKINHLNYSFSPKTILIVPSSARDFIRSVVENSNVRTILITQESAPSHNLKYQSGITLITGSIEQLNLYIKKQTSTIKRISQFNSSKPFQAKQFIQYAPSNSKLMNRGSLIYEQVQPSNPVSHQLSLQRVSSAQPISTASLSKVSESNLEYTITDVNQMTNRSIKSSQETNLKIGTSQLILRQTKDNMNHIYNNYWQNTASRNSVISENRKPSIALNQHSYRDYQDQIVEQTKKSINIGSRASNVSEENQPQLSLQSQIVPSQIRDSIQVHLKNASSLIAHPSSRSSIYKERESKLGQKRSIMRNTPIEPYGYHRTSHKNQRSDLTKQKNIDRGLNRVLSQHRRSNEYYNSEIQSDSRSINSQLKTPRPKSSRFAGKLSVIECLGNTRSKTLSQLLQKHSKSIAEHSQADDYQLDFGENSSLQLLFRTSSPYIQHLSKYFQVYPCSISKYSDTTQLIEILSQLDKSTLTVLVLDTEIVENVRLFKNFEQFNYIISCKQENIPRLKHRFPNTLLMKQHSHIASFKQLLSYVRYLKFQTQQLKISDKQIIPHLSAIQPIRLYSPTQPLISQFVEQNLLGFQITNYSTADELLSLLQGNIFNSSSSIQNIIILKNADERLIQYLVSSVFNVKKILVYGGEGDLAQLQSELLKITT